MERLGAVPARQQIACDDRVLVETEIGLDAGGPIEADEHLLIPEAECRALAIGGERLFLVAGFEMGLRQVEFVAGNQKWVGLGGERALEQRCLLTIMPAPWIAWTGPVASDANAHARKPFLTALMRQYPPSSRLGCTTQDIVHNT